LETRIYVGPDTGIISLEQTFQRSRSAAASHYYSAACLSRPSRFLQSPCDSDFKFNASHAEQLTIIRYFGTLPGTLKLSSCFHPLLARLDLIPAQRCSLSTASIFSSLRIFQLLHPYPTHLVCSFASPPSTGTLSHSHSLFSSTSPRRLVTPLTRPHSHGTPRPALPPSAFAPLHGLSNGPTRMPRFTPGSPPPA